MRGLTKLFEKAAVLLLAAYSIAPAQDIKSVGKIIRLDPAFDALVPIDARIEELKFNGVFLHKGGKLTPVIQDLTRPNGIAFSPDEKTLYRANSDGRKRFWMRYDVAGDGTVSNGRMFFDLSAAKERGIPDGMKLDSKGNVYAAGPEGVWQLSPEGKHLGTVQPGETAANCEWSDDGKTHYITASTSVYRVRVAVAGQKPLYQVYK